MKYRELGKTGLKVSEIGIGTEDLVKANKAVIKDVVSAAVEAGCNYFDVLFDNPEYLDGFGEAFIQDNHLIGFTGAIPQYGITGWELHPLVVNESFRCKGIGSQLVYALEKEVAAHGGITIYLGSDDEFGKTSLSGVDLFEDTFEKIRNIKNPGRHPYEFYQKIGYKIVGVIPDANGQGKPDIWMAKRIL